MLRDAQALTRVGFQTLNPGQNHCSWADIPGDGDTADNKLKLPAEMIQATRAGPKSLLFSVVF